MRIEKISCPHCNATIGQALDGRKEIFCSYCGGKIYINDDVSRTEYTEKKEKTVNINRKNETHYIDEAELQKAKNDVVSLKMYLITIGLLFILLLISAFAGYKYRDTKIIKVPTNTITASFRNALLGKASKETNLIVMEQELSVQSSIEKDGLFEWGIFKKNKDITYVGKAVYTVNLKQIRENDIEVNENKKVVTMYVPKPEMHDIIIDPADFQLGNTQKGLLSFGELKFTLEEAFYIESEAVASLKKCATDEKQIDNATKIATEQVKQLFEKSVSSIDSKYHLVIQMY